MKKEYPQYKNGDLIEIEKKLNYKNKKILDDFVKHCSINAGEGKCLKIRKHTLQFYDVTEKNLYAIDKETVDSFLIILNNSNRSMWTKNEIKVYLKKFIKWYYKDNEMIENIKTDSRRGLDPVKINENNLITEEDIEKMLRCAESFKEKAYLFLSFETGARPQELAELKWKNIKFEKDYADITLFSNKTGQSRTFPVKKSKQHLWEWKQNYSFSNLKPNDYVFPSRFGRDKPITSAGLNKMLRRMATASGLDKDVWNYLFRHTRATRLYEELPTPIVEKLMGHKNMSGVYAHISSKKAREAMLNKIYHIEELTKEEKEEIKDLKKEIGILKQEQKKFNLFIAEALNKFEKTKSYVVIEDQNSSSNYQ